jgi:hypothetical protein
MNKILFALLLAGVAAVTIAAVRQPVYVASATQILTGTAITTADCTVTQSFSTVYGAVPVIVCSQVGLNTTTTNVIEVTTSNFVLRTGKATQTNKWVAVGTP